MSSPTPVANLSADVREQFTKLIAAVRLPTIVRRTWERYLTAEERERAEADDSMGPDIIDIWSKLRNVSPRRAVLEITRENNILSEADFRWLAASMGEQEHPPKSILLPSWNKALGELRLGDRVIRRVKRVEQAQKIVTILDVFEESAWACRIDDPIPGLSHTAADRLRDAVKSLNVGLEEIRFSSDGTGKGIRWHWI